MASSSATRNESDFASALEQGFRSAGWKGALTKGIEARQAQRKAGSASAYKIATSMRTWEIMIRLSGGSTLLIRSAIRLLTGLKTDFFFDPSVPTDGLLNSCGKWGCRSSEADQSFPYPLEKPRPRYPHPEGSDGRTRETEAADGKSEHELFLIATFFLVNCCKRRRHGQSGQCIMRERPD